MHSNLPPGDALPHPHLPPSPAAPHQYDMIIPSPTPAPAPPKTHFNLHSKKAASDVIGWEQQPKDRPIRKLNPSKGPLGTPYSDADDQVASRAARSGMREQEREADQALSRDMKSGSNRRLSTEESSVKTSNKVISSMAIALSILLGVGAVVGCVGMVCMSAGQPSGEADYEEEPTDGQAYGSGDGNTG